MAHSVYRTKLVDGSRLVVLHVYLESDGASADLEDFELLDPAEDEGDENVRYVIESLTYDLKDFSARLEFDTGLLTHNLMWVMSGNGGMEVDFGCAAEAQGSFVLKLRKTK
jgi:hypothetical protein